MPRIPPLLMVFALLCAAATTLASTTEVPDAALKRRLVNALADSDGFQDRFDAEVWLTDMSGRLERFVPGRGERLRLLKEVHIEASRSGLEPNLVLAVIDVESKFDRFAISESGARGLMQIMPFWLKEIGRPEDNLFHIGTNLRFGCTILRYYLDREKGDLQRALARYNGSLGSNRYPALVFNALRRRWYR